MEGVDNKDSLGGIEERKEHLQSLTAKNKRAEIVGRTIVGLATLASCLVFFVAGMFEDGLINLAITDPRLPYAILAIGILIGIVMAILVLHKSYKRPKTVEVRNRIAYDAYKAINDLVNSRLNEAGNVMFDEKCKKMRKEKRRTCIRNKGMEKRPNSRLYGEASK